MTFTSTGFLLFVAVVAVVHRLIPRRFGWVALLAASFAFYALGGFRALIYISSTTLAVYLVATSMQKVQDHHTSLIASTIDR